MQELCLDNWETFEKQVRTFEEQRRVAKKETSGYISEILYRGQSQSSWRLSTTLERFVGENLQVSAYYLHIAGIRSEIESFTGRGWDIPTPPHYKDDPRLIGGTVYEYMVYLRHHGFPSPLLDWTTSPYIAAYFAFKDAKEEGDSVAIYAYLEYAGYGKGGWEREPQITGLGPNVKAHERHFRQRCQYTICTKRDNNQHFYCSHELAFGRDDKDQDLLWKFVLPARDQAKVLRHLDRFNISSFSLFGSEESLMESLAIREFTLKA